MERSHATPVKPDEVRARATRAVGRAAAGADRLPAKLLWSAAGLARAHDCFDDALAIVDALETRSGESGKALEERARIAFARGDAQAALAYLSARAGRSPSASALVAIARLRLETGDVAEAAHISAELSAANPELATVGQLAADVARAVGDNELARSYYLGALDQRPEHTGSLLALAQLSLDEGDAESAAAFYRRVAAVLDGATPAQLNQAAALAAAIGEPNAAAAHRARAAALAAERSLRAVEELETAIGDVPGATPAPPPAPRQRPAPAVPAFSAARPVATLSRAPKLHAAALVDEAAVAVDPRVAEALKSVFGHDALRHRQAAVIANALAGRDTLAIMPTGAGKSLTFQLPSLLGEQTTVAISPLIALMKDQVDSLPVALRERTALINSTLTPAEMRSELDRLARGELALVYVAPERLRNYGFLRALREAGVERVVIDEAHCISMWGHDFRPDYLFIPRALEELGQPPVLAITATATPDMVAQIAGGLGRDLDVVRASVFRHNLRYEVLHLPNKEAKLDRIFQICREERGNGIVYVSSRRDADMLASALQGRNVNAVPYHAGLDQAVRARNQDLFMTGRARVVVATVAFGMGVDKADVRFIVHMVAPKSLEAYAQESGRAGRDGNPARCILLVSPSDRQQLSANARRDEMDLAALRRVYAQLMQRARGPWVITDATTLRAGGDNPDDDANPLVAIGILEQAALVHRHPDAPATYDLRRVENVAGDVEPAIQETWAAIEPHLPPEWRTRRACYVVTADLAAASNIAPSEIDRALQAHPGVSVREGQRGLCLHLEPVSGDASTTLQRMLDRARAEAEERIRLVMAYANDGRCRHAAIAAHLGEALPPCGDVCDVCLGTADSAAASRIARPARSAVTADDLVALLAGVRTLPFQMGKTGIIRLLTGSNESRIRADRSSAFGLLEGVSKTKVDALLEKLIEGGWLDRDLDHEFKLVTLTRKGADATAADLAPLADAAAKPAVPIDADLDPHEQDLYERLAEWRRQKAADEAVPAYVVAHNSTLKNLAVSRPATKTALLAVPNFGQSRVDKYGSELLSLIGDAKSHARR